VAFLFLDYEIPITHCPVSNYVAYFKGKIRKRILFKKNMIRGYFYKKIYLIAFVII